METRFESRSDTNVLQYTLASHGFPHLQRYLLGVQAGGGVNGLNNLFIIATIVYWEPSMYKTLSITICITHSFSANSYYLFRIIEVETKAQSN